MLAMLYEFVDGSWFDNKRGREEERLEGRTSHVLFEM